MSRPWAGKGVRGLCALGMWAVGVAGVWSPAAVAKEAPAKASAASKKAFSADVVRERARELASRPYQPPVSKLSAGFARLKYDDYRDIRYRPERSWWRGEGLPFEVQFFHPGFFFMTTVAVHVVEEGRAEPVRFSTDLFTYGSRVKTSSLTGADGFAGFRLSHPLNRADYYDELVAFLGASYFRALGRHNVYGMSARGLAIDTALPSGEEFPAFRAFWLEKPVPGADRVVVHALLDSPSVAGAYRFVIVPGERTVMDVEATLFVRKAVKQLGVAPLTSMYLFGENDRGNFDDFRPEVHDSDGLFVWTKGGEQIWRPLKNPDHVQVSSFQMDGVRAFGLLQRDLDFVHYEDLEARYDKRPSVWVEPVGDWGRGSVRLVEIPTPDETNDNIVAAWVPEAPVEVGAELRFAYRLHWGFEPPPGFAGIAPVTATREAEGSKPGARRFVLDFGRHGEDGPGTVEAVVTASSGQVLHPIAQKNAVTGGWRATFELIPGEPRAPIELRCFLKRGSDTLTETWSYLWIP